MADPRVKDTMLVGAVASGLATVTLVVLALATGLSWWFVVLMVPSTLAIGFRYLQEKRRFDRDSDGTTP